jgi:hypothetical protein
MVYIFPTTKTLNPNSPYYLTYVLIKETYALIKESNPINFKDVIALLFFKLNIYSISLKSLNLINHA